MISNNRIIPEELLVGAKGLLVDLHGFRNVPDTLCGATTIGDFLDYALIGWDYGTSSYYIVGPENEEGEPFYWIGNIPRIESPYALVAIINSIFGLDASEFDGVFSKEVLSNLAAVRNSSVAYPEEFLTIDAIWAERANAHIELSEINLGCAQGARR